MDLTSKLKTDIICNFEPDTMWSLAKSRAGMKIILTKSNIPKSLWKYYLDAPELWEETEVFDGMKNILMMNSYHNVVPCWMRNATLEDLVSRVDHTFQKYEIQFLRYGFLCKIQF